MGIYSRRAVLSSEPAIMCTDTERKEDEILTSHDFKAALTGPKCVGQVSSVVKGVMEDEGVKVFELCSQQQ